MSIKSEIEALAIWFVVSTVIVIIFSLAWTGYFGSWIPGHGVTTGTKLSLFAAITMFGSSIDNFAVAIWAFSSSKKRGYNEYLWCAFGFFGSLVGGALYLLAVFSEQLLTSQSSTQPSAAGTPQDGASN